jgi:hypothetical protein
MNRIDKPIKPREPINMKAELKEEYTSRRYPMIPVHIELEIKFTVKNNPTTRSLLYPYTDLTR